MERVAATGSPTGHDTGHVTTSGGPPQATRQVALDDGDDDEEDAAMTIGATTVVREQQVEPMTAFAPTRMLRAQSGDTNSPRPMRPQARSQRNSSAGDAATVRAEMEWGPEDEGWVPKPARLHSGKTKSCAVCFAPLQFSSQQSWDDYLQSEEYLQRLQDNLLSDAFISSVICGEYTGGDLPTEYRMHKNRRMKCRQSVHDFGNMSSAGVSDGSFNEKSSVRILEEMLLNALPTPLLTAVLERRLAVISHSIGIAKRLITQDHIQKKPREFAAPTNNVEMHHLAIQTLAALLQSFNYENDHALPAFEEMARLLAHSPALSLFSFWSPAKKCPEKILPLTRGMVDASSVATTPKLLAAEYAVDGSDGTFWQSQNRPSVTYFNIKCQGLGRVSSIRIQWHLKCVPRTVAIEYRLAGGDSFTFLSEQIGMIGPIQVFETRFPATCEELRIVMSGVPSVNRSSCYAIEHIKLNTPISNTMFVDPQVTLGVISKWLIDARNHPNEDIVVEAIGALRAWTLATASLSGILYFVDMLLKVGKLFPYEAGRPGVARFAAEQAKLMVDALRTYRADEAEKLAKGKGKKAGNESRKIRALFEPSCCSAGVTVEDGGTAVRTRETSYQYAAVNVGITSGRASWRFRLDNDTVDDEMTCFGAAILPVTVSGYDSSPNLWMLRGYNGNLYARGHKLSRSIGKVHPGDIVQINVDMTEGTLSYKINDIDHGVVFTDIAGHEIYPAVSFYGSGKVITLLGVERWDDAENGNTSIEPVFLSNLRDYHHIVGYGTLGKGNQLGYASASSGASQAGSIQVEGESKQRCLSAHPPSRGDSSVMYDLSEGYDKLLGAVAINDDVQGDVLRQRPISLVFSILGDGKILWQSKPVSQIHAVEKFEVSVKGVRMLDMRVTCSGSNNCAHAIWVDPLLLPLEEWRCRECDTNNKGAMKHCAICGSKCNSDDGSPSSRQDVHIGVEPQEELCLDKVLGKAESPFGTLAATILEELAMIARIDSNVNQDSNQRIKQYLSEGMSSGSSRFRSFERPFSCQPCGEVIKQLIALLKACISEEDSSLSQHGLGVKAITVLELLKVNLLSIAQHDVTTDELGIDVVTRDELRETLEKLAEVHEGGSIKDNIAATVAADTIISGFSVMYTAHQKIQLTLSLLRRHRNESFHVSSPQCKLLSSVLHALAAPGKEGVLSFFQLLKDGDDLEFEFTEDVNEAISSLLGLVCDPGSDSSPLDTDSIENDSVMNGAAKLLEAYQLLLFAEAVTLAPKCSSDREVSAKDQRVQIIRNSVQDAAVRFACLVLRSCNGLIERIVADHDDLMLSGSVTNGQHVFGAHRGNLSRVSRLLPWLVSCLCLLRRQSWLALPVLPAMARFVGTMDRLCSVHQSVKMSESRLRCLELSVKARNMEVQEMERVLASDKALALHHQASKPMYNVFKQLYTGDKDHFDGQIGFQFEATSTFSIIALGRSVNPNKNGGKLVRQHTIRLWEEASQVLVAQVTVSAASRKDALGYAIEPLSVPVKLMQGKLYRLTTQEYAHGGDPWYKKENLPDEEYDPSYIKILRDCYASGSTGFPNSQNLSGAAYGVPTFLVEGADPLEEVPRFISPYGETLLKFSTKRSVPSLSVSHSGSSVHVIGDNDGWRTSLLTSGFCSGIHSIDFIVKSARTGGVTSGHVCVGVDWSMSLNHVSSRRPWADGFMGSTPASIGWMPSIASLWISGRRIDFGNKRLVNTGDILTMVIDFDQQIISFGHNGSPLTLTVGGQESMAKVCMEEQFPSALTPGVSIYGSQDVVQIRPSGIEGSTLRVHWLLDMHNSTASVAGRFAGTLIAGHPVDSVEEELLPWLQSPLLSGGIHLAPVKRFRDECPDWQTALQLEDRLEKSPSSVRSTTSRPVKQLDRLMRGDGPRLVKRASFFDDMGLEEGVLLENLISDMSDTGPAAVIISWLEKVAPDRSFLSRLGNFPLCERLTCAALIKHSPDHILHEVQAIITGTKGGEDPVNLIPSDDFCLLWRRIIMLRHWFIKTRQEYRAKACDMAERAGDEGAVEPRSDKNEEYSYKSVLDMKISIPKDFDELMSDVCERAKFLVLLNPPSEDRERMATESQIALSNLADKWSAQKTPPSLEPMLERWRSLRQSDSTKWSGIVDVLRAQHRWRARRASIQVNNPMAQLPVTASEEVEEDASDRKYRYKDTFAAILKACDLYVRNGVGAPPEILSVLLERRQRRSEYRTFGLDAMKSILSLLTFDSARHNVVIFLRPAFRGFTEDERESRDSNDGQVVAETFRATVRHHYLKGLEGCSRRIIGKVQRSFWHLYSYLANLVGSNAEAEIGSQLKQAIYCAWALDFEPRDHALLLKCGIISSLHQEFSMDTVSRIALQDGSELETLLASRDLGICDAGLHWRPLSEEFIQRSALAGGLITKRDIALLISRAPRYSVSKNWWEDKMCSIPADIASVISRHTASGISLRYVELLNCLQAKLAWCQPGYLGRKVLQFGIYGASGYSSLGSSSKTEHVSCVETPALGEVDDFTFEVWVFPVELNGYRVIRADNGFESGSVYLEFIDRQLQISVNGNYPREQLFKGVYFDTHQWTHVAVAYHSGSRTVKLYVNGLLADAKVYSIVRQKVVLRQSRIGCWVSESSVSGTSSSGERLFKGLIAEFRVWSMTRSDFQVFRDFQRAVPFDVLERSRSQSKLLALWHFDEGEGVCANDRLQPSHSSNQTMIQDSSRNANIVGCHWSAANTPVLSSKRINAMNDQEWSTLVSTIHKIQRFFRRAYVTRYQKAVNIARSSVQVENDDRLDDEFWEDEDRDSHVERGDLDQPSLGLSSQESLCLKALNYSAEEAILHRKLIQRCAWIVFRFLSHAAVCGIHERRDSEALYVAAAAKMRRKLKRQEDGSDQGAPSPPRSSDRSEQSQAVGGNQDNEDSMARSAEAASDAAKSAATDRQLEEPALQTLWFTSEIQRKVFEAIEVELVHATTAIQTAEGLTRAQRMVRSSSTPMKNPGLAVRPQKSVMDVKSREKREFSLSQVVNKMASAPVLEPLEVESLVFGLLSFVLSQSNTRAAVNYLSKPRVLRELLQLLRLASPRSQRVVKLILRRICGRHEVAPVQIADILGSASVLVDLLLDQVAESVCSTAAPMPSHAVGNASFKPPLGQDSNSIWAPVAETLSTPIGFRSGQVHLAAASESVALLRLLLKNRQWGPIVAELLVAAVKNASPILSRRRSQGPPTAGDQEQPLSDIRARTAIIRAVGALCVLGSHTDCIRIGGKVEVIAKETSADRNVDYGFNFSDSRTGPVLATVIELSARSSRVRVVFESTSDESDPSHNVQDVPLASISPIEEVRLLADTVALTADSIPVIMKLASLDSSEVIASFDELWRMQIRSRALLALESVLRQSSQRCLSLLQDAMCRNLLQAALQPVSLSTFVSLPFLQERGRMILCRLIESSSPLGEAMFKGLPDPRPFEVATDKSSSIPPIEANTTPVEEESGEYRVRRGFASTLAAMGFEFDLCMSALEHSRDDPNLAVEWLMGGGAEAYQERQQAQRLAASTLESGRTASGSDGMNDLTIEARAAELQIIADKPLQLVIRALELFNSDPNRAMEWLMEHGNRYIDKPETLVLLSDDIQYENVLSLTDEAALEEVDQDDPLVCNASHETSGEPSPSVLSDTATESDASGNTNIMAVTLAPIVAPLPDQAVAKKSSTRLAGDSSGGFAPLDPEYLPPYVLLTVSSEIGAVQRLSTTGRTGIFRSYSPNDGVLITFLNTETGAYEDEWHPPRNVRRITRIYDEALEGVPSIHRVALRTESALSTHYARRTVSALLRGWDNSSTLNEKAVTSFGDAVLSAVGGPRQFVNLLKLVAASEMVFTLGDRRLDVATRPGATRGRDEPNSVLQNLRFIGLRILEEEANTGKLHAADWLWTKQKESDQQRRREYSGASDSIAEEVYCGQALSSVRDLQLPAGSVDDDFDAELVQAIAMSMQESSRLPEQVIAQEEKEELENLFITHPRPLRIRQTSYTEAQEVASTYFHGDVNDHDGLLSSVLVKECVSHFVASTKVASEGNDRDCSADPTETLEFQSLHPYFARSEYTRAAVLESAHQCLRVSFDYRCKLGPNTKLTFFADSAYEKTISVYDGTSTADGRHIPDLIIHSNQFWFRFVATEDDVTKNYGYGYRFHVKPMQSISWSNESAVLEQPSLEWACWVLELILNEAKGLVARGAVHNRKIYGALVRYARSPGAPFKSRVVQILIQLLHEPELFPLSEIPELETLEAIGNLALQRAKADRSGGRVFISAHLQQLVELSVITRRAALIFEKRLTGTANDMVIGASTISLPTPVTKAETSSVLDDFLAMSCFLLGTSDSLPGHILVSVWMEVFGSTGMIESAHPFSASTTTTGSVELNGAQTLLVTFDARCSTGEDSTLQIRCAQPSSQDEDAAPTSREFGGHEAWPSGTVAFSGDCLEYAFAAGENSDARFGVSACVFAIGLSIEQQLSRVTVGDLDKLMGRLKTQRSSSGSGLHWSPAMDGQLVDWINNHVESSSGNASSSSSIDLKPMDIRIHPTQDGLRCSQLLDVSLVDLHVRFALLKHFNQLLKESLPFLDLRDSVSVSTIAHRIRQLGHCIFFDIKNILVEAAIEATHVPGDTTSSSSNSARITLDRLQALESRDDREVEPSVSECFFAQAFRQLNQVDSSQFRRKIDNKGRLFSVKFRGEEGVDWGGVYREGVNSMVDDLFSAHFNLFVLCPNGQHDTGTNRGMYLPNPKCTSPVAIQMYEFVGKLLGISFRTHGDFPFAFPSLVWKQLIGQSLDRADLEGTDAMFVQMLDGIQNCERDGIVTEDEFETAFEGLDLRFTAFDCNGQEIELVEGGKSTRVTFENRLEYCQLAEQYRLQEGAKQVAAMARGLATIFPVRVLTLLTWHEMEMLTCGSPKIDINLWKQHTRYDGYNENDDTIKIFWEAMASFTDEQRSDFVRFAWGRSRLPRGKWPQPFKLTKKGGRDSTLSLPVAHTCFFSVELPPYTTLEKMRAMLLATINFGLGGILMA